MEGSVHLTMLGGVNEVGGNAILVEDEIYNAKVLLDFGINTKNYNDNYEKDVMPESINELIRLNLLPDENKI